MSCYSLLVTLVVAAGVVACFCLSFVVGVVGFVCC